MFSNREEIYYIRRQEIESLKSGRDLPFNFYKRAPLKEEPEAYRSGITGHPILWIST